MKKKLTAFILTGLLTVSSFSAAFAGTWVQDQTGWWYQNDDKSYPVSTWQQINEKWYYFDSTGYMVSDRWEGNYYLGSDGAMLVSTITPDGYQVGPDGAWIPDAAVSSSASASISASTPASTEETHWSGKFPYITGMSQTKPTTGSFWTVNISTGKYHITPNVSNLLQENTRYYTGDAAVLEANGYSRCQRRGCY